MTAMIDGETAVVPHVVAVTAQPGQVAELTRVVEVRDAEISRLQSALEAAQAAVRAMSARIEEINDGAIEWADDNSLCGEFERFCEEYGLRGRTAAVTATVSVTLEVSVGDLVLRRGCDRDDVTDAISDADVTAALRREYDVDLKGWEVNDWDVD